jgi:hypothetical protein
MGVEFCWSLWVYFLLKENKNIANTRNPKALGTSAYLMNVGW